VDRDWVRAVADVRREVAEIVATAEALRDGGERERGGPAEEILHRAVRAGALLNALLRSRDDECPSDTSVYLHAVEPAVAEVREPAMRRGLRVVVDVPADLAGCVAATALRTIVTSVLLDALAHADEGTRVSIVGSRSPAWSALAISYRIQPDAAPERLQVLRSGLRDAAWQPTDGAAGVALSLSTAHALAQAFDGEITAAQADGTSTVTVRFPAAPDTSVRLLDHLGADHGSPSGGG
jgi:hypothetical protein